MDAIELIRALAGIIMPRSFFSFKYRCLFIVVLGLIYDFAFELRIDWPHIEAQVKNAELSIAIACIFAVLFLVLVDAILILRKHKQRDRLLGLAESSNVPPHLRELIIIELLQREDY